MVHSNLFNYAVRDKLALQFKERMLLYHNVNLIIVELVYGNKHFKSTEKIISIMYSWEHQMTTYYGIKRIC